MKLKTILFAFLLTIQNIALAMPANSLRGIYDDYIYSLTVEWDQVDQERLSSIQEKFKSQLSELEAEGLLTKEAIKEFIDGEAKSGKVPAEVLDSVISPSGAIQMDALEALMKEQSLHNRGANWSGAAFFAYTAIAFLPALLVIAIITESGRKDMCTLPSTGYGLGEPYPCN